MRINPILPYWIFISISLIATHPSSQYEDADTDGIIEIKVLVGENIEGALLDLKGGYKISNIDTKQTLSSGFFAKRNYLQTLPSGLKWGEGFPNVNKIKITPKSPSTTLLVGGIQYKGALSVYNVNGKLQLVNELDVEEFLSSFLCSEFSSTHYNKATYDALAIVARTSLYASLTEKNTPFWDIKGSDYHYEGLVSVHPASPIYKSIKATRGLILTYEDIPFHTAWTENSGGKTASYSSIFRKRCKGPDGVTVAYAQKEREGHRWKCNMVNQELASLLELKKIRSIDLYQDPQSKKVYGIRFADEKNIVELSFKKFQETLGKNRILSNDFSVHMIRDYVLFEGYGSGFGVGLCLFSADQMAKCGDSSLQILSNFFPGTSLIKLTQIPESFLTYKEEGE
jgi:SpoIID/LytB domain protein